MDTGLDTLYTRDRDVWNTCARTYERQIVCGHPDVAAYEAFEEDLLDRLLYHVITAVKRPVMVYDIGCGSGRLHLRYGRAMTLPDATSAVARDEVLGCGIASVGGLDFSKEMLDLAKSKVAECGLNDLLGNRLWFKEGSAFELEPLPFEPLPIAVTLCNSIGVMQGEEGAAKLFQSLRRCVESAGGIALISAYRREAVASHALGNYESTMDVSGQPRWLVPDTYAGPQFVQVPHRYKRAFDPSPDIEVSVFDKAGACVKRNHTLSRDPAELAATIRTGHIRTYSDYESRWYSDETVANWIQLYWGGLPSHHLAGARLDRLRAAPAQLALLDPAHVLDAFFDRYERIAA